MSVGRLEKAPLSFFVSGAKELEDGGVPSSGIVLAQRLSAIYITPPE